MTARDKLFRALDQACRDEVFPGCVAAVWKDGALVYHEAHGSLATDIASPVSGRYVERESVYDLASLTKVLATTTLCAIAVSTKRLSLDQVLPEPLCEACPGATLADLLGHCAGLVAHREYFSELHRSLPDGADRATRVQAMLTLIRETPVATGPGEQAVYSDLGFILLGAWLEMAYGRDLDALVRALVVEPLGLQGREGSGDALGYRRVDGSLDMPGAGLAPTEVYSDRDPEPSHFCVRSQPAWGEVHDDNCFLMGGVAGHAGLFGTAEAVIDLGRAWLDCSLPGLSPAIRDRFWERSRIAESSRCLGFDGTSPGGSTGDAFGSAVGHLGFTGTSLWIEPATRSIYVLLSNRVHPSRENCKIRAFRPVFHQIAAGL